ncbi:hypothetical protein B0H66DRAFT_555135 [Apodospora peruviana]|uniref:AA1-like domain-containing protein n=1 Tax=Apodospora peruviana TaxID=516989 RepID=A0AAE0M8S1_9PEZI|nr:hypothetical protein B0H66DRAFT_555135 [Apodospora peruviana]
MKWSSSPLTFAFLLLPGFLVSASRPCNSPNTPIKWTLGEFTYDAPDKTSPDTVVGLYLTTSTGTDYSCYGAWRPESSAGFLESSNTTIIWFPCVNSKGRAIDRTVSFAMDWRRKVLRAAHMFDCSNGVSDG